MIRSRSCETCHVCGGPGRFVYAGQRDRLFGAPGEWRFKKCVSPKCGLVWLDPMPVEEDLAEAYATYYTHDIQGHQERPGALGRIHRALVRAYVSGRYGYSGERFSKCLGKLLYLFPIRRFGADLGIRFLPLVPGGRLLDVGCGAGEWLGFMEDLGWDVEGVDFDVEAVRTARNKGMKVRLGCLEAQRFPTNSFDAITLNHVIEHVTDPLGTLTECRRVMKARGRLFLATPNNESWGHRLFGENWRGLEPPRHLHIMSPASMRRLLEDAGFTDFRVDTHSAHYIIFHSYRLSRLRERKGAATDMDLRLSWLVARMITVTEHFMRVLSPEVGECLSVTAIKS